MTKTMTDEEAAKLKADLNRGQDVAKVSLFSDAQLAEINGYADAAALLSDAGVDVETISDYGTGFSVNPDNEQLLGLPFVILSWRFNEGSYGERGFVSAEIVTKHNEKLILNDGSTGICAQLRTVSDQRLQRGHAHPYAGLICPKGLTVSRYFYHAQTGEISRVAKEGGDWSPASTYYLSE